MQLVNVYTYLNSYRYLISLICINIAGNVLYAVKVLAHLDFIYGECNYSHPLNIFPKDLHYVQALFDA